MKYQPETRFVYSRGEIVWPYVGELVFMSTSAKSGTSHGFGPVSPESSVPESSVPESSVAESSVPESSAPDPLPDPESSVEPVAEVLPPPHEASAEHVDLVIGQPVQMHSGDGQHVVRHRTGSHRPLNPSRSRR